MQKSFADSFAVDWIESWNAHDLERVLAHYSDDFAMSSPMIVQLGRERSGTLHGKAAVRAYWSAALERFPDLRFELISVLVGVGSITLCYKGARGWLVAEVFHFGSDGTVTSAFVHYAQ